MTYQEARVYLDEQSKYGSVLGLDTIRALLEELGNPQDSVKFIHIAGTNGKGSVLAMVSTVLGEAGFRTGRYSSPVVISYLEKIQADGVWITEEEFAELTEEVQKAIARMETNGGGHPTVFEIETAIAFLYFQRKHCEYVVLETGLGGSLDATNIVRTTEIAVFTTISMDHMCVLGDTLEKIAEKKAGIIKPGCEVVSAPQHPRVRAVLAKRAKDAGCRIRFVEPDQLVISKENYRGQTFSYKGLKQAELSLAGSYQAVNAATACEVLWTVQELTGPVCSQKFESVIRKGLQRTVWAGRFTCIREQPVFLVDGAHNEDAALCLRETVKRYFPEKRLIGIMGVFRDKEYRKIVRIMAPLLKRVYTVNLPDSGRTLAAETLKEVIDECAQSEPPCTAVAVGDISRAVERALGEATSDDVILAFGSLSYLGEVMQIVREKNEI